MHKYGAENAVRQRGLLRCSMGRVPFCMLTEGTHLPPSQPKSSEAKSSPSQAEYKSKQVKRTKGSSPSPHVPAIGSARKTLPAACCAAHRYEPKEAHLLPCHSPTYVVQTSTREAPGSFTYCFMRTTLLATCHVLTCFREKLLSARLALAPHALHITSCFRSPGSSARVAPAPCARRARRSTPRRRPQGCACWT